MKHLIIPDVHERIDRLEIVKKATFDRAASIIFLGDWFDKFGAGFVHETRDWIRAHEADERMIWLLGNHDCHYAFTHINFMCSGYRDWKRAVTHGLFTKFKLAHVIVANEGFPIYLSHAGFNRRWAREFNAEVEKEALEAARKGLFHPIFEVGASRGGHVASGGLTWLDWNHEFDPIAGIRQVVGHTHLKTPKEQDGNWCIDTGLRHVAWVDDCSGEIQIEEIEGIPKE